ncbi:rubrerythrin family protein [Halobacterium litoreum]|uniref:Rubrerythrin family protein n=1 Tax=Halobacterium litoreum TaxID=2039234 RepID=A0ABD5NEW6_9EURY|nr:rubrerythrin family protein [Halobacterium litoreum]UHH13253.1 rubrerythrin family protein [Halobacterium litoreum]
MNATELLESVRADNETALSRLGSSKSLYAATGGEMEADAVLRAAADAEYAAARTFDQWADTEGDEGARDAFETTASEEDDHYETVVGKLGDYDAGDDLGAMQSYLRGLDSTPARAGGLLGRLLATEKSKEQLTGFFVGQADPQTAQLFRELKGDLDDQRERALSLLDSVCNSDDDWDEAKDAADGAIQAAYDEYTEQLEAMGVNPKPVC